VQHDDGDQTVSRAGARPLGGVAVGLGWLVARDLVRRVQGDTELRIIAAWFLALGVPPFLAGLALWRGWKAPAAWVVLGCLALIAFWIQQLSWFSVALVSALRTGTWSGVLDTLFAWHWLAGTAALPRRWSDLGSWVLWFTWGLWSQLVVALVAFVQALRTGPAGRAARRRATAAA